MKSIKSYLLTGLVIGMIASVAAACGGTKKKDTASQTVETNISPEQGAVAVLPIPTEETPAPLKLVDPKELISAPEETEETEPSSFIYEEEGEPLEEGVRKDKKVEADSE